MIIHEYRFVPVWIRPPFIEAPALAGGLVTFSFVYILFYFINSLFITPIKTNRLLHKNLTVCLEPITGCYHNNCSQQKKLSCWYYVISQPDWIIIPHLVFNQNKKFYVGFSNVTRLFTPNGAQKKRVESDQDCSCTFPRESRRSKCERSLLSSYCVNFSEVLLLCNNIMITC